MDSITAAGRASRSRVVAILLGGWVLSIADTSAEELESPYLDRRPEAVKAWRKPVEVAQRMSPSSMRSAAGLQAWNAAWQPDTPRAFAYQYLFTRLQRAKADVLGSAMADARARRFESMLDAASAELDSVGRQ